MLFIAAVCLIVTPVAANLQMDWTQATATADFSARNGHKVLTYNDRLWVIGGYDTTAKNDVWYSFDGVTWYQTPSTTPRFSPRQMHGVVEFNGRMWVVGGYLASGQYSNDIWSSTDGATWTKHEPATTIFSKRYGHSVIADNGKLWVIGGYDGSFKNDVWSSTDGVNWVEETTPASARFPARHLQSALVYHGKMWVMAGEIREYPWVYTNDVWSSSDGVNWYEATPADERFNTRSGQNAVVYDDAMWVIGGVGDAYGNVRYNDAWYSTDGAKWTKAVSAETFASRYYADATVYKSKIWVIGGYGGSNLKDVWYGPKDVVPTPTPTQEPVEHSFSITNALSSDIGGNAIRDELKDNQGWRKIFEKPNSELTKMQFGVSPGYQDDTLNDATLHWHSGHGGPKKYYDNQGQEIKDLGNDHTFLELPGSVRVYPNDITEKWGGKNKWVILQSCYILSDLDWGNVLGTTHGIFGYASVTNMHAQETPELSVKFLKYAESGETLYDSWYRATKEVYHNQKVGTTWVMNAQGYWELDNYAHQDNIIAATIFKDDIQRETDRLPGSIGYTIASDNSANTFVRDSWDCHTGFPREPES